MCPPGKSMCVKVSTGDRIPLEPTLPQPQPAATASTELPPATAPNMTPQAPAQDGVVQLTPEAQRVKDQEEVYRAWQRAHEEAEQEKRRRTRRHHEIAAQVCLPPPRSSYKHPAVTPSQFCAFSVSRDLSTGSE